MKINGSTLIAFGVIAIALKTCGGDSNTPTGHRATQPLAQASVQAYQPSMVSSVPSQAPTQTRYVGPKSLNARSSPNGRVVGALSHGTAVDVYAERDGWIRISPELEPERWVSSAHVCTLRDCGDMPRWRPKPVAPSPAQPAVRSSSGYASSCPCSSSSNCIGPRGGRYCITSGGNKRYR